MKFKKLLATVLSAAMICTMPAAVQASEFSDGSEFTSGEAVNIDADAQEIITEDTEKVVVEEEILTQDADLEAEEIFVAEEVGYSSEFAEAEEKGARPTSGKCGDNITWTLKNGVLTLTGTGKMYDYNRPAYDYTLEEYDNREDVKSLIISDGITYIGDSCFAGCKALEKVIIPNSVMGIAGYAFSGCSALKEITIPNSVTWINYGAFSGCSALEKITIPNSVTFLGWSAFAGTNLKTIYFEGSKSQWENIENISEAEIPATCKVYFADHEHVWSSWKTTKKATVLASGKQEHTCSICDKKETKTLKKLTPTGKLNKTTVTFKVNQVYTPFKVTGLAAGDKVKSYTSSNKKIFIVTSKGKITAKAAGSAKLTITLASGKKLTATVKVVKPVKTTKLTVNKTSMTLTKGKTFQIKAVCTPSNSTEKITYSSSKKTVATVSSTGKITAKGKGTAYITVKSGSKSVKIKVVVK